MAQESQVAALNSLFTSHNAFVTYQPLRTEVAFASYVSFPDTARAYVIPPRAGLDPVKEAHAVRTFVAGDSAIILLPGRAFDATGTRLGQGGGWYDRFLADVPREWLRVGFCFDDQFSATPLPRAPWDQPVDYVVVVNRKTETITLYSSEGALS